MKSIRFYQRHNGKESLLVAWSNLPDCILEWFAKNFDNAKMDSILRPFNLRDKKFIVFLDLCAFIKQGNMNFPFGIARMFDISEEDASALDHQLFSMCFDDVMDICDQGLDKDLFWRFKDDCPGNEEQRESCFEAKICDIKCRDIGRASAKICISLDVFGFPLVHRRFGYNITAGYFMYDENNVPIPISEEMQEKIKERNIGRFIKMVLSYKYDDEWSWDIKINTDIYDVMKQLDLPGLPIGND